jgi:16S rRNA (cytosine967-C5)-methyltransferase
MIAPARQAALRALDQVERGATLADALARERDALPDSRDRALVTEIATGTLRWLARLDAVLAAHSSRPLDTLDPVVRRILRLAAYQLLFLDRIPARAVVDDAVEQTRVGGHQKATGFANGLLRSLIRGQSHARTARNAAATRPGADLDLDALAAELSHPRWLLARWVERYGLDAAVRWTRFNNEPAALTLRTNTSRGSREALLAALADEAIVSEPTTVAAQGLRVRSGDALSSQAMRDGRFIVQDEASQLVGELAAALAGPRMLDACAAPGGKTLTLATALPGAPALVVAADRRPRRLRLLKQNLVRGGIRPTVLQIDLRRALPFPPIFDLVLVDAPCSGLGTLRREPDIKWRRAEAELPELARAQGTMLDVASRVVAPGGRLVYATCSSEPEENDEVVDAFLGRHPEFEAIRAPTDRVAPGLASVLDGAGRLRTLPHEHGLEAFFASSLVRHKGVGSPFS